MLYVIEEALEYYKDKKIWENIVIKAIESDNSWDKSANTYKEFYESMLRLP